MLPLRAGLLGRGSFQAQGAAALRRQGFVSRRFGSRATHRCAHGGRSFTRKEPRGLHASAGPAASSTVDFCAVRFRRWWSRSAADPVTRPAAQGGQREQHKEDRMAERTFYVHLDFAGAVMAESRDQAEAKAKAIVV